VLRGRGQRREIALTFDDGPHPLTRDYLDVLDAFEARATFFVVGQNCGARRLELAEIARRGHELAGHGFTHTPFPNLGRDALLDELERTHALLPARSRRLVRPPKGMLTFGALAACATAGYTTVLFSLDTLDYCPVGAKAICASLMPDRISPGEIVLLHEGQAATLEALPRILSMLRDGGYATVTMSELLS
jgi:peptidoglycan/xylan/chitin deacetylase (PgdA/CDA1 family)